MCEGDFLSKNPEEAMDFLSYVEETSKAWDKPNPREAERMKPASSSRGGMYSLPEDMELKAKLSTLARRVEELEGNRLHEAQAVTEVPLPAKLCFICQSTEHVGEQCPTIPTVIDMFMIRQILLVKTNHHPMPHITIHIAPTGEIIPISLGSQTLQLMSSLVHDNRVVPHLNHNHHQPHLLLSKLL